MYKVSMSNFVNLGSTAFAWKSISFKVSKIRVLGCPVPVGGGKVDPKNCLSGHDKFSNSSYDNWSAVMTI